MAGKFNFILTQGTTFEQFINLKDANEDPLDLQDYKPRMQIRSGFGGDLFANVSCSITQTSGSNIQGTIRLNLTAEDTANLNFTKGLYDLEIASGSIKPYVQKVLKGTVKLNKEITR